MHLSPHNNQSSWKPFSLRGKGDSLGSFPRWKESGLLCRKYQFIPNAAINKSNGGNNVNNVSMSTSVLISSFKCCTGSQTWGWNCSPLCLQCTVQRALDESQSMASKIHFKADIPVSCRSLGEKKKIFKRKSSYFERHCLAFLYLQQKGSFTALVFVLCRSLWTEYGYC